MRKTIPIILLLILFASCHNNTPTLRAIQGDAFGTTYNIQYYATNELDLEKGIDSVIYAVNKSVSTYMPASDISKINRGDSTLVVDSIFREVYRVSQEVYINSKGFFDPTVGVLRNAYGFGDTKPLLEIDSLRLDSLRAFVGFGKVKISPNGTVQKEERAIYFDFNAVAKGYGIDLIGRYLNHQGVANYIIELGGEILTKGKNLAKDKYWVVGVESIDSEIDSRSARALVRLNNEAMAASGNYRKFLIDSVTGKKYVHTINPHTGKAEQNDVTSAAVIAANCGLADAYATAIMAMGFENAKEMVEAVPNIDAYITYNNTNNEPMIYVTEGFVEKLID